MYNLAFTGFSTIIYAVAAVIAIAVGLVAKLRGRNR